MSKRCNKYLIKAEKNLMNCICMLVDGTLSMSLPGRLLLVHVSNDLHVEEFKQGVICHICKKEHPRKVPHTSGNTPLENGYPCL